jgi:hypothetical protein
VPMSKVNDTFNLFNFGTTYNDDDSCKENEFFSCNYQSFFQNENDYQSFSLSNLENCTSSNDDEVEDIYKIVINNQNSVVPMQIDDIQRDKNIIEPSKKPSDREIREKKFWTKSEDDLLLSFINQTQNKNWNMISEHIKTKSAQQCAYRYNKLLSDLNKKKWNRKDDIRLIELVEAYGQNWTVISSLFGDRNEKDVETRFKEKLDPNVKNTKFTEEEDHEIIRLYEIYGNDWFQISRHFKNRNAKMIKKRFQTYLKFDCKRSKRVRKPKITTRIFTENESVDNFNFLSTNLSGIPTRSNTPRSSATAVIYEQPKEDFNVENYFDKKSFKSNNTYSECDSNFDVLSASNLKFDLLSSYSSQIDNIDKYFSQICLFYTEKSLKLEQAIAKGDRSKPEIANIIIINSQVSSHVNTLMCEVRQMQRDRFEKMGTALSDQFYKTYIVRYIEIVLNIIQQIKLKLNLFQTL